MRLWQVGPTCAIPNFMGFGFRKTFSSGPFRMTFSKSGMSMSIGAGGARLTAGPRGTHVSFSKGGFYYRTRLDAAGPSAVSSQPAARPQETFASPAPQVSSPVEAAAEGAATETFGDIAPDAFVDAMNRRVKRRNYALPAGIVVAGGLIAASTPWPFVAVASVLATVLMWLMHSRLKYSSLLYGSEEETAERLTVLHKAIAALRSADSLWSVWEAHDANGLTPHPPAWNRERITGDLPPLPKYLRTNITPAILQLRHGTLYFFPDRLFIWHSDRFAAIDYREMKVQFRRIQFLERERQPPDAMIESRMRLSLLGNGTAPILYYGLVEISASGLDARLVTSCVEGAQEFVAGICQVTGAESAAAGEEKEALYTNFDGRVPLFYNLDESGFRRFEALREAFSIIQRCDCVWRYEDEQRTDDWKHHAGAGTLVRRSRLHPALVDRYAAFDSNVAFGFSCGDSSLLLLPDGFLLATRERYQNLGNNIHVDATTTSFTEEEFSPKDAELVGRTWRYVNKSGGPDRRFNDNRQIPIYRYGQLEIGCGAWKIRLCLSRAAAAAEFAGAIRDAVSGHHTETASGRTDTPPARPASVSDVAAAYLLLGLKEGASPEQASAAYKRLAAQNHPDKVAQMAPEFRELAERKMRELNAAFETIRTAYK